MNISIFGLGYVGVVSGACLAKLGQNVIGVDLSKNKVELINEGKSPIVEKDLSDLIMDVSSRGLLRATESASEAVLGSDISLICVGTPGNTKGNIDLSNIERVCIQIGESLRQKVTYHLIVIRSTILPGTVEKIIIPNLEAASEKRAHVEFGVCYNPEFMREGSSIYDFFNPPMNVIGGVKEQDIETVEKLYGSMDTQLVRTGWREAEAVKYVCNAFHALKISFANEIGTICKELSIDSHDVMEIFCKDRKLNISQAYLKPGFAFGGSCLPKDLRALNYKAKELDIEIPLLNSILSSNEIHIQRALELIYQSKKRKIGILGLSFKPGTDDLRESPLVTVVETLIGKGFQVKIYDKNVSLARLTGSNKEFIEKEIPHIASVLTEEISEIFSTSEVIVIGDGENEFKRQIDNIGPHQIVIDIDRVIDKETKSDAIFEYHGICW